MKVVLQGATAIGLTETAATHRRRDVLLAPIVQKEATAQGYVPLAQVRTVQTLRPKTRAQSALRESTDVN